MQELQRKVYDMVSFERLHIPIDLMGMHKAKSDSGSHCCRKCAAMQQINWCYGQLTFSCLAAFRFF